MSSGILIINAQIINEGEIFPGSVLIKNDIIKAVFREDQQLPADVNLDIINAKGSYLMPGVIDDHVHFREPGLTHKADIHSESLAAVAGGVTSFMDMPNTVPQTTTITLMEEKMKLASEQSLANYAFYLGATNDNFREIDAADPRITCGIKVFMGSSTGNMLVDNDHALEKIFKNSRLLIAVHSEYEPIIRANAEHYRNLYGENVPIRFHPAIRSREACFWSTDNAVRMAKRFDTRLHILHLSTAAEIPILDPTPLHAEKRITSEVCVHHLWFDDRDYDRLRTLMKWNPAIKTEADRTALLSALFDGKIDVVATDHAPHTLQEKSDTYFKSPSGGPLVQHSLPLMFELIRRGKISPEKLVEKMCHNPAMCFDIEKRGFIREGYYADLVIVNADDPWMVDKSNILYKCGWSPFEGTSFHSKVTHTFVNGHLACKQGQFDETMHGQSLLFRH